MPSGSTQPVQPTGPPPQADVRATGAAAAATDVKPDMIPQTNSSATFENGAVYQQPPLYAGSVYGAPTHYGPHPAAMMPSQQTGYYQFDPNYVQSMPFGYYANPQMQMPQAVPAFEYTQAQPQQQAQPMWNPRPAPYPYRPAYIRQSSSDPYQVFDEEGNALSPQDFSPYLPQPIPYSQPSPVYSQHGYYPSGTATPTRTPYTISRQNTNSSSGGRHSRGMSGMSSADSQLSSDSPVVSPVVQQPRNTSRRRPSPQSLTSSNSLSQVSRETGSSNGNGSSSASGSANGPASKQASHGAKARSGSQQHQQQQQQESSARPLRSKQVHTDTLPRPPPHSDFALWVGNVPSDATHAELWNFFSTRPAPPPENEDDGPQSLTEPDQDPATTPAKPNYPGVKSIHLIARTNCCFVNYVSQRHLDFSLKTNHGSSLRPQDPKARDLVCRIRRKEDSSRTGVGAQRTYGIHKSWVAEHEKQRRAQEKSEQAKINSLEKEAEQEVSEHPPSHQNSMSSDSSSGGRIPLADKSSSTDRSTNSTSSSFLARYFAKRYFILKARTPIDLEASVANGLWSTQKHNQPVLDRAYSSAREGVFLFFSANGSGEFFGVARMTGPISTSHVHSKPSKSSSLHPLAASGPTPLAAPAPQTVSPQRIVSTSPQPATPDLGGTAQDNRETYLQAARETLNQQRHYNTDPTPPSHEPEEESTIAQRRGASLDTASLSGGIRSLSVQDTAPSVLAEVVADREERQASHMTSGPTIADQLIFREYVRSPQEANEKLESMPAEQSPLVTTPMAPLPPNASGQEHALSEPFPLEWLSEMKLNFSKTRHLRNAFNKLKEIKISRDGTELDPVSGESLLSMFIDTPPSEAVPS